MIIRYSITKIYRDPGKKKRIIQKNFKMEIRRTDWDNPETHKKIRRRVSKLHPGWMLAGYCKQQK